MPRSYASTTVATDPDNAWLLLRNFNGVPDFVDAIATSELLGSKLADQVGAERKLTFADGAIVIERLVALSDVERSYTYYLIEGPFPFTDYYSTIRVSPLTSNGTSFVEWWSTYDCAPADAKSLDELLAGGLYTGGLAAVQARFA